MSFSPAKNLDPLHPRKGIVEKKLPHADLILPWPWNQMERVWGERGTERESMRESDGEK